MTVVVLTATKNS